MGITPEELRESLPAVQLELGQQKGRQAFERGDFADVPSIELMDEDGQPKTYNELVRQANVYKAQRQAQIDQTRDALNAQTQRANTVQINRLENEPELRRLEREQSNLHDLNILDRQAAQQNALARSNNELAMQYAQMMNENNNRRYQQSKNDAMLLLALQGLDGLFSSFG